MTAPNLDGLMPYSIQLESAVTTSVLQITDTAQRNSPRFSYCHRLSQGTYLVRLTYDGPGYVKLAVSYDEGAWPLPIATIPAGAAGAPRTVTTQVTVPQSSVADLRMWCTDSARHFGSLEIFPTSIYRAP